MRKNLCFENIYLQISETETAVVSHLRKLFEDLRQELLSNYSEERVSTSHAYVTIQKIRSRNSFSSKSPHGTWVSGVRCLFRPFDPFYF